MPSLLLTENTPLLPLVNTTNKWKQIIKNWITGFFQEIKFLTLASLWISSAIFMLAALNVIGVQANSHQDIDFEKAYFTIIKWEVLVATTISLFISSLKKSITNFGNNQFKKTLLYNKLWNKLTNKIFINTSSETKLNFEEIKNKINLLETNKITLIAKIKEFHNLQQQLVVKFETLLNNINENETTLDSEENIDNSRNLYLLIINELIKIIATVTTLTAGVAFASSINIIKNDIANDLPLNLASFIETFTSLPTIIISFSALIVFKLKFNLFENGLNNVKHSLLWKLIKKLTNKTDITEADIEAQYNKIKLIKIWYDTNIIKLDYNLNEIKKNLEIRIVNSSNYNDSVYQNIKYFFSWLISTVFSMTLDNYFYIISAQIAANKKIDFINNLKLLITKENIITAIIAQIGFSFKLTITDLCWKKFKTTYTYQALNYIGSFPKNIINSFVETQQYLNLMPPSLNKN